MELVKKIVDNIRDKDIKYKHIKIERDTLLKPILENTSYINLITEWIYQLSSNQEINTFRYDPKHFVLFLIPFLYSPRTLIFENMNEGVRAPLAEVIGVSESHISNSYRTVYGWWMVYPDFRSSIDYLYSEILNRIENYGLR